MQLGVECLSKCMTGAKLFLGCSKDSQTQGTLANYIQCHFVVKIPNPGQVLMQVCRKCCVAKPQPRWLPHNQRCSKVDPQCVCKHTLNAKPTHCNTQKKDWPRVLKRADSKHTPRCLTKYPAVSEPTYMYDKSSELTLCFRYGVQHLAVTFKCLSCVPGSDTRDECNKFEQS